MYLDWGALSIFMTDSGFKRQGKSTKSDFLIGTTSTQDHSPISEYWVAKIVVRGATLHEQLSITLSNPHQPFWPLNHMNLWIY
jgi:hypothetical protein